MSGNLSLCVKTGQAAFREGLGGGHRDQFRGMALYIGMVHLGVGRRYTWEWRLQMFNKM